MTRLHSTQPDDRVPTGQTHPRRGFTLIELLVVVSIILLLVAILLPSLDHAQQVAGMAACASNEHQLGTGMLTYTSDNMGLFPPTCQAIMLNWQGGIDNKDTLDPTKTDGSHLPIDDYTSIKQSLIWKYVPSERAFLCPIFKSLTNDNAIRSYSMNWNLGSNVPHNDNNNEGVGAVVKVNRPNELCMFTEENPWSFQPYSGAGINDADFVCQGWPGQDTIGTYHMPRMDRYREGIPGAVTGYEPTDPDELLNTGIGNCVFVDGHVVGVDTRKTVHVMYNDPQDWINLGHSAVIYNYW